MSTSIKNRYDFILLFDVKDGNPNGDPDAGNLPRVDPETGRGLVTDVCLKRKIRNFIQITKNCARPYDIYVKEKSVLGRAHVTAFQELGISTGQESRKPILPELTEKFAALSLPEGLTFDEGDEEKSSELIVAADADKKAINEWLKEEKPDKAIVKLIKDALKEAKPRKPTSEETEQGRGKMCQDFYDIRTFGAVLSLKSAPNCGQVRGPVQLTFGRSVDPIVTLEHCITRMAVATEAESEKQSGDNRTMGRKNTVPYGLYLTHGFISSHLANQTGFTEEDLALLKTALGQMFELDRSAARGMMSAPRCIAFKHASALGNAPAHKLFDLVKVAKKAGVEVPRQFSDYDVTLDLAALPAGVTVEEWI